ncbi:MAG: hypothetical protein LBI87_15060 [Candidatus Accumulibacter sp.]|jgi:hypothetical protein|nr:hypothetical protein [Accumulibacter sp.]
MKTHFIAPRASLLASLLAAPLIASAAVTDLSDAPLSGASSAQIKPNIVFIMDDSTSMEWDYLPDWAAKIDHSYEQNKNQGQGDVIYSLHYQRYNPSFNGIAYDPAVTYFPPNYFDLNGIADTAKYPSQTSAASNNWKQVPVDGYGVQSQDTKNLVGSAFYYLTVPGEYCTDRALRNCVNAPDANHTEPAYLRWCKTQAEADAASPSAGACQAMEIEKSSRGDSTVTYSYPRMPAPWTTTLNIPSVGTISSIKVNGVEILSAAVTATTRAALAEAVMNKINACFSMKTGQCPTATGYLAEWAGGTSTVVTLKAPDAISFQPVVTSPDFSLTVPPFVPGNNVPGYVKAVPITPETSGYPRAYQDEMTNYANWYAYYRTRMQAMKTAVSRSFGPIDDQYRIGYFTINNNNDSDGGNSEKDFQNVADFSDAQKHSWYDKLFAATPTRQGGVIANTPLRKALSNAGWLFAGKLNTLYGVSVDDPMQYYCQPNVAILSTDGYWNEDAGFKLDGTPVGDQDGPSQTEPPNGDPVQRPQLDGGAGARMKFTEYVEKTLEPVTETWFQKQEEILMVNSLQTLMRTRSQNQITTQSLQSRNATWAKTVYTLRKGVYTERYYAYWNRTDAWTRYTKTLYQRDGHWKVTERQLQKRAVVPLQERTGVLQGKPKQFWNKTTAILYERSQPVLKRTNGMFGWSGWDDAFECTTDSNTQCAPYSGTMSAWAPVSSCTPMQPTVTQGSGDASNQFTYTGTVECKYDSPTTEYNLASCTPSTGLAYSYSPLVTCAPVATGENDFQDVASCDPSVSDCRYVWSAKTAVSACSGNTYVDGSFNIPNVTQCLIDEFSEWEDTDQTCVIAGGVECRYSDPVDSYAGTCTPQDPVVGSGNTYGVIQARACNWEWTTTESPVNTCQASDTRRCYYASNESSTSISPPSQCVSVPDTPVNGVYTGPAARCVPMSTGGYVDTCPPGATSCSNYHYWSYSYPSQGQGCTPVTHSPAQFGDVSCNYSSSTSYPVPARDNPNAPEDACVSTNPATPPTGDFSQSTYQYCRLYSWPSTWTTVAVGGKCTHGNYQECRYVDVGTANVSTCDPADDVEQSPGPVFTERSPKHCIVGYTTFAPVSVCPPNPAPTDPYECSQGWTGLQDVTDPAFDPARIAAADPNVEIYGTRSYSNWYSIVASVKTTSVPKATADDPLPTNAGFCEVNPDGTQKVTYEYDATIHAVKKITCRAVRPGISVPFRAASCNAGTVNGVKTTCNSYPTGPTADPNCGHVQLSDGTWVWKDDIPATAENNYVHTRCSAGNGVATDNTLADVAEYYWKTDLRTPALGNCTGGTVSSGGIDVNNDVCVTTDLTPRHFMKTFTLGLGASGFMQYQSDYKSVLNPDGSGCKNLPDSTGDFYSVCKGLPADPDNGVCSWQTLGNSCNWPKPMDTGAGVQTNIDDLRHAAVNGRGTYFSAQNPEQVAAGISAALMEITVKEGSLSEPTLSDLNLGKGDVLGFKGSFTSESWEGDLLMFPIDANGKPSDNPAWTAKSQLNAGDWTARTIYAFHPTEGDGLKLFTWSNLTSQQQASLMGSVNSLTQMCATGTESICISAAARDSTTLGKRLVDFLRGDRSDEGAANETNKAFRQRAGVLGDIVNSTPAYVKVPPWRYTDNGYSEFRYAMEHDPLKKRAGRVYVGANDGMLHAFDADTGQEVWAYVPSFVLPTLYQLADKHYSSKHRFYVDGSPVSGDICTQNCAFDQADPVWKTILVGGANHGGRGFYALDITDADNPKRLWEFTSDDDVNLGYSYGNPVITKLASGKWVVLLTSGYNNVSGDGKGHLYVLDANDGTLLSDISTSVGDPTTPSGLAKISGWASNTLYNNTARYVYGGDLLGNMWRFDINPDPSAGTPLEAYLLATLKDDTGKPQPITTAPEITVIKNKPVVFIGTGQLLGAPDMSETTDKQSFYAIKDPLDSTTYYDDPRGAGFSFVQQTMTAGLCPAGHSFCVEGTPIVTLSKNLVDWATDHGWYVDFPAGGERVNVPFYLDQGTLSITTNKPQIGACVPAGVSYKYFLDYLTGGYVEGTDGIGGSKIGDYLSTGGPGGQTAGGGIVENLGTDSGGREGIETVEVPVGGAGEKMRRISWRELIVE